MPLQDANPTPSFGGFGLKARGSPAPLRWTTATEMWMASTLYSGRDLLLPKAPESFKIEISATLPGFIELRA